MKIIPIRWNTKIRKAFNERKSEFYYRIAADPITTDLKIRKLKNGSTVYMRYTDKFGGPHAYDIYMFRPDLSIKTKTYHYIRESNASDNKPIGKVITKQIYKKNSYEPDTTTTKTIWE